MAERAGFEPAVEFDPYDGLANRSFRPLRHLSAHTLELYSIIRFLQPEIPVFFNSTPLFSFQFCLFRIIDLTFLPETVSYSKTGSRETGRYNIHKQGGNHGKIIFRRT